MELKPYKLIVAGGRDYANRTQMVGELNALRQNAEAMGMQLMLVCGMARGADSLAHKIFMDAGMEDMILEMPADWSRHGKSAGYRRNEQMAQVADGCLCFWDGESKGTGHMIDLATKYNLHLKVVRY